MDPGEPERPVETATVENRPSATAVGEASSSDLPHALRVGASVARYVVLEEVGRGGMGRVVRAYDPKLQREVALKEVRVEVLGPKGTERLVVEARAMAKLSHPNVVAVYDVEELDDGRVVLVMEYVAGATLRSWLDAERRSWRDVVDRLRAAGAGLAAAHAVGVLHRDFKPANVLVGNDGSVKVTDFGVAKLAGSETESGAGDPVESAPELTEAGSVLGTPRYMAPEQHFGETLTAAADQYAFCVALWEALCGKAPFAGEHMVRAKTTGPPAWPDGSAPRTVGEAIRRGLSPKPEDRWPNLPALCEVLARDPAAGRKRWLAGVAAVGVAAVGFEVWHSWSQWREQRCTGAAERLAGVWDDARREEARTAVLGTSMPHAPRAWERAAAQLDGYAEDWIAQHEEACEATTVRGEQSAAMMDLRIACLERARMQLDAVARVLGEADADVVTRSHTLLDALPPLDRCADAETLQSEVQLPLPRDVEAVDDVRALLADAYAEEKAGRYRVAHERLDEARKRLEGVEYEPIHAEVRAREGMLLGRLGDFEAAEQTLRVGLEIALRNHQWSEAKRISMHLVFLVGVWMEEREDGLRYRELALGLAAGDPLAEADVHSSTASILRAQAKYPEAEAEHRLALRLATEAPNADELEVTPMRTNLGYLLLGLGRNAEAEAELREVVRIESAALGPEHPEVAVSSANLASVLNAQGEYAEAETVLRDALRALESASGPGHYIASAYISLGISQYEQGNHADAADSYRHAIEIGARLFGPDRHLEISARNNLANALLALGEFEEAEAEHRRCLDARTQMLGPEHPEVATSVHNIARVLWARKELAESEVLYRRALDLREKVLGPDHPEVARTRFGLGVVLADRGAPTEAVAELRAALGIAERSLGPEHPEVAMIATDLAAVLLEVDAVEEATALAERAWALRDVAESSPMERGETAFVLATALAAGPPDPARRARALELAEQGLAAFRTAGPAYAGQVKEVAAWLDAARR